MRAFSSGGGGDHEGEHEHHETKHKGAGHHLEVNYERREMVKGPDRNLKPRLQKLFTCVTHWGFTTKISQLKGQAQCKSGLLMWTTTLVIMVIPVTGKYESNRHGDEQD